ncbi:unnamed protein product, partial [Polarella glacialis]
RPIAGQFAAEAGQPIPCTSLGLHQVSPPRIFAPQKFITRLAPPVPVGRSGRPGLVAAAALAAAAATAASAAVQSWAPQGGSQSGGQRTSATTLRSSSRVSRLLLHSIWLSWAACAGLATESRTGFEATTHATPHWAGPARRTRPLLQAVLAAWQRAAVSLSLRPWCEKSPFDEIGKDALADGLCFINGDLGKFDGLCHSMQLVMFSNILDTPSQHSSWTQKLSPVTDFLHLLQMGGAALYDGPRVGMAILSALTARAAAAVLALALAAWRFALCSETEAHRAMVSEESVGRACVRYAILANAGLACTSICQGRMLRRLAWRAWLAGIEAYAFLEICSGLSVPRAPELLVSSRDAGGRATLAHLVWLSWRLAAELGRSAKVQTARQTSQQAEAARAAEAAVEALAAAAAATALPGMRSPRWPRWSLDLLRRYPPELRSISG